MGVLRDGSGGDIRRKRKRERARECVSVLTETHRHVRARAHTHTNLQEEQHTHHHHHQQQEEEQQQIHTLLPSKPNNQNSKGRVSASKLVADCDTRSSSKGCVTCKCVFFLYVAPGVSSPSEKALHAKRACVMLIIIFFFFSSSCFFRFFF